MNYWLIIVRRFLATFFVLSFLFLVNGFAQNMQSEQAEQNELIVINKQVWSKFYEAFSTSNYKLMAEIHHNNLIRISGNSQKISDYKTYINLQKKSFENAKEGGENREIELRFFERFYNKTTASERGIYQLTVNKDEEGERRFYGQFHVIHKKELGLWKIFMDYDSNENNKVNKTTFDAAKHIDEVEVW